MQVQLLLEPLLLSLSWLPCTYVPATIARTKLGAAESATFTASTGTPPSRARVLSTKRDTPSSPVPPLPQQVLPLLSLLARIAAATSADKQPPELPTTEHDATTAAVEVLVAGARVALALLAKVIGVRGLPRNLCRSGGFEAEKITATLFS